MESRDEQLIALEAAVESAEKKLKSAEMSVESISEKLKNSDEAFQKKFTEKSRGYFAQTGAELKRDELKSYDNDTMFKYFYSGIRSDKSAEYSFYRYTSSQEQKKRRKLVLRRNFDSSTGKTALKAEIAESDKNTVDVTSVKDLKKPVNRKKFVAYRMLGYRKLDISSEANPFIKTVGAPIVVPVQTAAKIADKLYHSPVVQTAERAARTAVAPVVIPARIIKDIKDNGGIIHSIADLGDRIKIEGVNVPKPLESTAKIVGGVSKAAALGAETAAIESVKEIKNFSIEIAKEKLYEEISNSVSENEAANAAYVVGMKVAEIYSILDEHDRFRRAVARDKAGNDITDISVSKYLADKEERKYRWEQLKLKKEKQGAESDVKDAQSEYEAAKKRLEQYKAEKSGTVLPPEPKKKVSLKKEKEEKTKTEKKYDRTEDKLYKLKNKAAKSEQPVATAYQTAKRLDELSVNTTITSLRRKAMRDGGDNTAVEAADFAVTSAQAVKRFGKVLDDKKTSLQIKHYEGKLQQLENQKKLETEEAEKTNKLHESKTNRAKESSSANSNTSKKKRTDSKKQHEAQKESMKKKHHRKAHTEYVHKQKIKQAEKAVSGSVKAVVSGSLGTLIPFLIIFLLIILLLIGCTGIVGGSSANVIYSTVNAPCSINDMGKCDRYYTELGKNLIERQRNIKDEYVGYDKYKCTTEISEITHSPKRLLPYLSVKATADTGGEWKFEDTIPYIEDLFNAQYELYANEVHETRKKVRTVTYTVIDDFYSSLGNSVYKLDRPYGIALPETLSSAGYADIPSVYTHVEYTVCSGDYWGYIDNTLYNVGEFTDLSGNTYKYEDSQALTFHNNWKIDLVYDYFEGFYLEYWRYTEERQEYSEYDYVSLEYGIKENTIYTDTDFDSAKWQNTNFDKLIYNRVKELDDDSKTEFEIYSQFLMGHQFLALPFDKPLVTKNAGYNNKIDGDLSLDYSMEIQTYSGQEIICGMDGEINKSGDNSFSVYNKKYGTLYYDYVNVPETKKGEKGKVITTAKGDILRITFIDNSGEYLNPLFLFS